jgi:hypothetical protein
MNLKHLSIGLTILIGLPGLCAGEPAKGFKTENLVLYQPDSVLRERLPSVEDLASYVKRLQAVCGNFFADVETPETLDIIVALKPGRQSRVWFVSSTPSPSGMSRESLRVKLEAVTPVEVRYGPVAFAISAKIAGGSGNVPKGDGAYQPPIPKEWQEAAKGQKEPLVIPDGFLALVWPDKQ